jgi:hypothetical protein
MENRRPLSPDRASTERHGVGGSAISGATPATSDTNNLSSAAGSFTNLWVYRATGTGTGSSPAVTVTFGRSRRCEGDLACGRDQTTTAG